MIKLIAAAGFLVAVATSAHAITPAPIPQPDGMLSQVRLGAARLGPELLVSAWPEPLSAIPANSTAEPTAGAIEVKSGQSSHDFIGCTVQPTVLCSSRACRCRTASPRLSELSPAPLRGFCLGDPAPSAGFPGPDQDAAQDGGGPLRATLPRQRYRMTMYAKTREVREYDEHQSPRGDPR